MRIYQPATIRSLRTLVDDGELGPVPLTAFAVTGALREFYLEGDDEEFAFAALTAAARASLRLLDADPLTPRRRVVIVADVADEAVTVRSDLERAAVRIAEPIGLKQVAAAYVDEEAAEKAVRAAAVAVMEADLGSADAQFVVDGAEGFELGWYATQEIGPLVELL
ncbi:MAG TPA: hypothetical protein VHX59_18785 [Mycobacteriales bacterium]|jgi:hypothetical protein|nr:hypothetical protein [Mycobacteriales bacterium]